MGELDCSMEVPFYWQRENKEALTVTINDFWIDVRGGRAPYRIKFQLSLATDKYEHVARAEVHEIPGAKYDTTIACQAFTLTFTDKHAMHCPTKFVTVSVSDATGKRWESEDADILSTANSGFRAAYRERCTRYEERLSRTKTQDATRPAKKARPEALLQGLVPPPPTLTPIPALVQPPPVPNPCKKCKTKQRVWKDLCVPCMEMMLAEKEKALVVEEKNLEWKKESSLKAIRDDAEEQKHYVELMDKNVQISLKEARLKRKAAEMDKEVEAEASKQADMLKELYDKQKKREADAQKEIQGVESGGEEGALDGDIEEAAE
jgi:hypothetical protein